MIGKTLRKVYNLLKTLRLDDSYKRLSQCDVLFFCHDVDRGVTLNNRAYSPLIDSIRDIFEEKGLKCQTIAHPFSTLTNDNGHGSPISINRRYFFFTIITRIFPKIIVEIFFPQLNIYRKIINRTRARLIITIDSRREMCNAAQDLGCLCIELLHGVSHTSLPAGWKEARSSELPQGILSLSDRSTSIFSELNIHDIKIKTIPHPFLKRFTKKNSRDLPKEWHLPPANRSKFKKEILVSLMWGYSDDHGPNLELANILKNGLFYEELALAVAETPDIFWRFRFHPVQLRERQYSNLIKYMVQFVSQHPNSEWKQASTLPLPSVASICSGNISMASGACYDVASMGLKSLMLCPTIQDGGVNEAFFTDLVQEGYAVKDAANKDRILSWAQSVEATKPRLSNLHNDRDWDDAEKWMLKRSQLDVKLKSGTV
tara:strand:+ start:17243 stop:18529 length:1287 start_codon:yes stop_codon:yes gene_type:complete